MTTKTIILLLLLWVNHSLFGYCDRTKTSPKDIHTNIFEPRNLQIKGDFNAEKALLLLFPGDKSTLFLGRNTIHVVHWRCANCRPKRFQSMTSPEEEVFPAKEGMTTRAGQLLKFKTHNKERILMPISSSYYTDNLALAGRISSSFLGLALFEKSVDTWKLVTFDPAIQCFGHFMATPTTELLQIGKNYAFTLKSYVGGINLPQTCDKILIGQIDQQFKVLRYFDFFERKNADISMWKSQIRPTNYNVLFSDLEVIIKGKISTSDLPKWDIMYLSETIQKQLKKNDMFEFELHQNLSFNQNGYVIKNENLRILKN